MSNHIDATTTVGSECVGQYDIGNAKDGAALAGRFTICFQHTTYAVNDHWTTRAALSN